jgi:hypothetical protein
MLASSGTSVNYIVTVTDKLTPPNILMKSEFTRYYSTVQSSDGDNIIAAKTT